MTRDLVLDDERLGFESASSARRRRQCPGSANLSRALREAGKLPQTRSPNDDAASGTRVHQAWSMPQGQEKGLGLDQREMQTVESLRRMEAMLVTDWARGSAFVLLGREQRLWLHEHLVPIHSGAFDVAYGTAPDSGAAPRILILDGKTLTGEVEPAFQNDQLRELVALARANFGLCEEFTVAILQPLVSTRASVATYDVFEAELALRELRLTLARSADPAAPRIAGPWCRYCPAFEFCDQPERLSSEALDLSKAISQGAFALPLGEDGARLLDAIKVANSYFKAVTERYKVILAEDPDCVPGWQLRPRPGVRVIRQIAQAAQIAAELIKAEDFESALKLNVSTLQERLSVPAGGLHGKALADFFNKTFESVIEIEPRSPELAKRSEERA